MRSTAKALFLLITLAATMASATDYPQGLIKHVIVVIQENRTPDNLFGSAPTFEDGVNIVTSGKDDRLTGSRRSYQMETLNNVCDIGHTHADWQAMYHNGAQDEAYNESKSGCSGISHPTWAQYAYVENDANTTIPTQIQPYFDIAKTYGFANYMFQTNQGPSFPAHQFLFSGTSAPVLNDADTSSFWEYFAAENPPVSTPVGCLGLGTGSSPTVVKELDYTVGDPETLGWTPTPSDPSGAPQGYPCYLHYALPNVLSTANPVVNWRYYTTDPAGIWTAPVAIEDICEPNQLNTGSGATCNSPNFSNVIQETYANSGNAAQIMYDIQRCALANVTFVTPDGSWSDHAGPHAGQGLGAFWVADIINQVGRATSCDTNGYWKDTVILITWDDWGGWYDHVVPPIGYSGVSQPQAASQYVYGFRVPLLVVSAYMATKNTTNGGYVSGYASWSGGDGNAPTSCPTSPNTQYCHDFGSILNFIEYVFGSGKTSLGEIYPTYHYADYYAMDGPNVCGSATCPYSLSDFFNFNNTASSFTSINVTYGGTTYDANYFENYTGAAQDPDD
jgi:phospholipase C